ncbi:hypothetical protein Drorol1_Dr00012254, partial [Drosera rotundifolia]
AAIESRASLSLLSMISALARASFSAASFLPFLALRASFSARRRLISCQTKV